MANQTNRLLYAPGKGAFLRILWRASVSASTGNLVVLPSSTFEYNWDPGNEDMTEADSLGRYMPPTLEMNVVNVSLRQRHTPISLEALGIRSISFVDAVAIDIGGTTGLCDWCAHMSVGAYQRSNDQKTNVMTGFSLVGGAIQGRGVAIPQWAQAASGSGGIPNLAGYFRSNVALPTGL